MSLNERQITDREVKALQIAAKQKLTRKGNVWFVPSQAGQGEYEVRPDPQAPRCTCPDFEYRNAKCKHVLAVEYTLMRETTPDGGTVVTETVKVTRKTYSQDWKAYNHAQTHEKSELQALHGLRSPLSNRSARSKRAWLLGPLAALQLSFQIPGI